jgi:hypothetical protein
MANKIITPIKPKPRHLKVGMRVQRVSIDKVSYADETDRSLPDGEVGTITAYEPGAIEGLCFRVEWDNGEREDYCQCELVPVTETWDEGPCTKDSPVLENQSHLADKKLEDIKLTLEWGDMAARRGVKGFRKEVVRVIKQIVRG